MAFAGEHIEVIFPGLRDKEWRLTSPSEPRYNCIAWAAHDTAKCWWPADPSDGYHWPEGVERVETLTAFLSAFSLLGYELCAHAFAEPGYEKLAIFATPDGIPTHAARQLATGRWTSKLGMLEDIEHDLMDICGEVYGSVVQVMRRAISE